MNKLIRLCLLFLFVPISVMAQSRWVIESETKDYKVFFRGDTVEIFAPKGFTLWWKQRISNNVCIEYDACVIDNGQKNERLSDLNCFWMATDPQYPNDIFKRTEWRTGNFNRCYSLQTYYLGYGGNNNKTTRFRRYDGDYKDFVSSDKKPDILKEYTDKEHLLQPNKWYHIRITASGDKVQYEIDGNLIIDYRDSNPLTSGWFGFRTTHSHTKITNFQITKITR